MDLNTIKMKTFTLITVFLLTFSICYGQKAPVESLDLQRDGKFYQRNHIKPFTGVATEDYPNGKKKSRAEFKDGVLEGKVTKWHNTGEKSSIVIYKNGIRVGKEVHFYPTGNKKLEINYNNKGLPEGICKEYHDDESLLSEGKYIEGVEEGLHKWYYKDGSLDQSIEYFEGRANGKVLHYFRDGTPKMNADYKDGQPHGVVILFHNNGKKKSKTDYKEGKEDGKDYVWSKKGLLLEERKYSEGEEIEFKNYRSGAIKTKVGFLQVFNEAKSFFSIHLDKGWIRPRASRDITYVVNDFVLQLYNSSTKDLDVEASNNEEAVLNKYMASELKFIKQNTTSDIEVDAKFKKGKVSYLHWSFESPTLKDVKYPSKKTVIKEQYFSVLCGDQVLSLYVPQTRGNNEREIMNLVDSFISTIEVESERIDLNSLRKKIRVNAGLPPLRANEKVKEFGKTEKDN